MPILWRYLLRSYFQVFTLCVCSFIAILLIMRFQEIARFAALGGHSMAIALFTLYQIPYILPIAIPISCLIAAILLFQRLSHTHELTAFRSSGLDLKAVTYPLILAASLLSIFNFTVASEISPRCRELSKELIYEMTTINPLFLLQKETLIKLKNAFFDMKVLRMGKYAEDVVVIINNTSHERLGMMVAKELSLSGNTLSGKDVAFISSLDAKQDNSFDHLVIENQNSMTTEASTLSQFLESTNWKLNEDYLSLREILAKERLNTSKHILTSSHLEIARRASLAIAALTFTVIGCSFGMAIGRHRTKKGMIWALCLSSCFMICFLAAKSVRHSPLLACIAYLAPHPIILFLSLRSLKKIARGIE